MSQVLKGLGSRGQQNTLPNQGQDFAKLFYQAHLAEKKNDTEKAAELFAYVSKNSTDKNLKELAAGRLAGITAEGATWGQRLEHLGTNALSQATAPAALGGMAIAGLAYQSGKYFTMTQVLGKEFGLVHEIGRASCRERV